MENLSRFTVEAAFGDHGTNQKKKIKVKGSIRERKREKGKGKREKGKVEGELNYTRGLKGVF